MKRTRKASIVLIISYLVLAASGYNVGAEETGYSIYPHLEPEATLENYGVDVINFDWGREWDLLWEQNDNGIRAGGASISNPNLLWLVEAKAKRWLTPRFNFGYHYRQTRKYSYKDEEVGDFEIECRLKDDYYASVTGRPFFYKPDADFGVKLKYHKNNVNYVHLEYVWVDAFINFIHGRIENEPVDKEYHLQKPAEYRLASAYTGERYLLRVRGQIRPESAALMTFFTAGENNNVRRLSHGEAEIFFEYKPSVLSTIGMQAAGDETEDKREFAQLADTRTLDAAQKQYALYLYYMRRLSGAIGLTVGGICRIEDYNLAFPHNAAENYEYDRKNVSPLVNVRFGRSPGGWAFETGYLADFMHAERKYPNNTANNSTVDNEQQRIIFLAEYLFTVNTRIKIILGLDADEWKTLVPYDHGGVFFTTCW